MAVAIQPLVLIGYINLLSVPANQRAIVDDGALKLLGRLANAPGASAEVRRYVGMALANVADDLSLHANATHAEVLDMMTRLATNSGLDLQRIIASAFAMFAMLARGSAPHERSRSGPRLMKKCPMLC